MAEGGVDEAAEALQRVRLDDNSIPGNMNIPGYAHPYILLPDIHEDIFEPISRFAIQESGHVNQFPLDEEQMKAFLTHKLNRSVIASLVIVHRYTPDHENLKKQLEYLHLRIKQIQTIEKGKTEKFMKRITDLEKALNENRVPPQYRKGYLRSSFVTEKALDTVGRRGPLTQEGLFQILDTGNLPTVLSEKVFNQQLRDIRLQIHDEVDIKEHREKFVIDRIKKAIQDIETEMSLH